MKKIAIAGVALLGCLAGANAQDIDFGITAGYMNARGVIKVEDISVSDNESSISQEEQPKIEEKVSEKERDVCIEVEEASTGSANISMGFSTMNNIFGTFEVSERNFNFKGIPQIFTKGPGALRGSGEYIHLRATIGAKQTNYLLTWVDPYFFDSIANA